MSRIRLVALDVDGTLLDGAGRIGERTARRVAEARARGVGVVLVSGRPFPALRPYARLLGLELPLVCCHGALVAEAGSGRVLRRFPLAAGLAGEVAGSLAARGMAVAAYAGDVRLGPPLDRRTRAFYRAHGLRVRSVGDLSLHLRRGGGEGVEMVVARAAPDRVEAAAAALADAWPGRVSLQRPGPGALDVVAAGVCKEARVAELARELGVSPAGVLAVGNGDNDAGLLAWAGVGVAVADATPGLKGVADWVVPGDEREGVAAALERFVLAVP